MNDNDYQMGEYVKYLEERLDMANFQLMTWRFLGVVMALMLVFGGGYGTY